MATLFAHTGIESASGRSRDFTGDFADVENLLSLWGCILCIDVRGFYFWAADAGPDPGTHASGAIFISFDRSSNEVTWLASCCGFIPDNTFDPMASGAALVRVVPEPQTWALLAIGLAAGTLLRGWQRSK